MARFMGITNSWTMDDSLMRYYGESPGIKYGDEDTSAIGGGGDGCSGWWWRSSYMTTICYCTEPCNELDYYQNLMLKVTVNINLSWLMSSFRVWTPVRHDSLVVGSWFDRIHYCRVIRISQVRLGGDYASLGLLLGIKCLYFMFQSKFCLAY